MNSTAMLDSFQLIIGIYLLIVAIRGNGQLYSFNVHEDAAEKVRRNLRSFYFALAGVTFLDGGVNILQNTLYICTFTQSGAEQIVRNAGVSAPEWMTYPFLTALINGLIALFLLLIGALLLMLRKYRKQKNT